MIIINTIAEIYKQQRTRIEGFIRVFSRSDADFMRIAAALGRSVKDLSASPGVAKVGDMLGAHAALKCCAVLTMISFYMGKLDSSEVTEEMERWAMKKKLLDICCYALDNFGSVLNDKQYGVYELLCREVFLFSQPQIFELLFVIDGIVSHPHKKLCFLHCCLLEELPGEIFDTYSSEKLDMMFIEFINIYAARSVVPRFILLSYFYLTEDSLGKKVKDNIPANDGEGKTEFKYIQDILTGETMLKNYYSSRDEEAPGYKSRGTRNISDWCFRFKKSVVKEAVKRQNDF